MPRTPWLACLLFGLAAGCQNAPADTARFHNQEGVARLQKQDYVGAKAQFESALAADPNNANALENLAAANVQSGNHQVAERCYRQAIAIDPNRTTARHGLAVVMLSQGRREETNEFVSAWALQNADAADAQAEWGWYLRETGDYPAAQARLQKALELNPNHVRAMVELGHLYENYSYPDRAKSLYEQALARNPEEPEAKARLTALRTIPPPR